MLFAFGGRADLVVERQFEGPLGTDASQRARILAGDG